MTPYKCKKSRWVSSRSEPLVSATQPSNPGSQFPPRALGGEIRDLLREFWACEQKCELEYTNYRYLTLRTAKQLEHHIPKSGLGAFGRFLELGKIPDKYKVRVKGEPREIAGIVLIWGKVAPEGRASVKEVYGAYDILSLEDMINDLVDWNQKEFRDLVSVRRHWCNQLFLDLFPSSCQ